MSDHHDDDGDDDDDWPLLACKLIKLASKAYSMEVVLAGETQLDGFKCCPRLIRLFKVNEIFGL